MAKLGDIKINVDSFLTDTRLLECRAVNCKFHSVDSFNCNLKQITLNQDGKCLNREEGKNNVNR